MGGIHPRFKREVGRRLALAFFDDEGDQQRRVGPTLAGCTWDPKSENIDIRFNKTLLGQDDAILLMWSKYDRRWNMSTWAVSGDASTMMVCVGARDQIDTCRTDTTMWIPAPLRLGSTKGSLLADVVGKHYSQQGEDVLAIRYGWPLGRGGDTCCPSQTVEEGTEPCVPGSCPILTTSTSLPANPFYAEIDDSGGCKCIAPQVCGG